MSFYQAALQATRTSLYTDAATLAYLFKYDSVHGTIPNQIGHTANGITIDGTELRVFSSPDPAEISDAAWLDFGTAVERAAFKDTKVALEAARALLDNVAAGPPT